MEQPVIDYLTKQVQIDRNVVTFRSLSRQFNIHVNAAKNNLAAFHAASRSSSDPVYATYMLTGEFARAKTSLLQSQQDKMEVDSDRPAASGEEKEAEAEEPDSEVVPLTKVLLVGENDVEQAKAQYLRLFSQFVYSVSPTHLIDSSLICAPSEKVYEADAKLKADASTMLGRLVGPHVHIGKPVALAPLPTKSAVTLATSTEPKQAATVKSEKQEDKPKLRPKDDSKPALKPKLSGFFDWGKAKTKQKEDDATKDEEKAKVKEKEKAKVKPEDSKKSVTSATEVKEKKVSPSAAVTTNGKLNEKRGLKRKSTAPITSDDEVLESAPRKKSPIAVKGKEKETVKDEKPSTSKSSTPKSSVTRRQPTLVLTSDTEDDGADSPAPAATGKKKGNVRAIRVVISDSDEDEVPSKWKAKGKARSSAMDKSLKAMMDIDDDEVTKASRPTPTPESELEETEEEIEEIPPETQTEDLVEDSEPERVAQRPRKKQQKKLVPVGRNGLKKRRVMRTRTKTDEKGYMVTEDYSSYESVDEEEAEEPVKSKGKGKKGTSASTKGKKGADEDGKDTADTNASKKDDNKPAKPAEKPAKARKSASRGGQGSLMNFFGAKTK